LRKAIIDAEQHTGAIGQRLSQCHAGRELHLRPAGGTGWDTSRRRTSRRWRSSRGRAARRAARREAGAGRSDAYSRLVAGPRWRSSRTCSRCARRGARGRSRRRRHGRDASAGAGRRGARSGRVRALRCRALTERIGRHPATTEHSHQTG
jgi:hypothetical protein